MSENIFIKKRKRARGGATITTRHIVVLLALGLTVYGGFRFWVGNPNAALCGDDCGSAHSLMAWVLGFAMIFGAVIGVAAIIGVAAALVRRRTSSPFTEQLDHAADQASKKDER